MPERIYREKPEPGPIEQAIDRARSDAGRRRARLGGIADAFDLTAWTVGPVRFTVTDAPRIDGQTGMLRLSVLAVDTRTREIIPGLDNPYFFDGHVPMHVKDGTWYREEIEIPDPDVDGQTIVVTVERETEVEDPVTAFREHVASVVFHQATKAGWSE